MGGAAARDVTLAAALRRACRVTGEMAGALERRKMRPGDLERWAQQLREAAKVLDDS